MIARNKGPDVIPAACQPRLDRLHGPQPEASRDGDLLPLTGLIGLRCAGSGPASRREPRSDPRRSARPVPIRRNAPAKPSASNARSRFPASVSGRPFSMSASRSAVTAASGAGGRHRACAGCPRPPRAPSSLFVGRIEPGEFVTVSDRGGPARRCWTGDSPPSVAPTPDDRRPCRGWPGSSGGRGRGTSSRTRARSAR